VEIPEARWWANFILVFSVSPWLTITARTHHRVKHARWRTTGHEKVDL
jgi:hypothetical protein